jgi:hypothetical protein
MYKIVATKPKMKRSLGRPRSILDDNISMELKILYGGVDGFILAENWAQWQALVNTVTNLRVP